MYIYRELLYLPGQDQRKGRATDSEDEQVQDGESSSFTNCELGRHKLAQQLCKDLARTEMVCVTPSYKGYEFDLHVHWDSSWPSARN